MEQSIMQIQLIIEQVNQNMDDSFVRPYFDQ